MNTEKSRVLAYSLSKEISNEELSQVSGGSNRLSASGIPTYRVSGASLDVVLDVVEDTY